MAFPQTYGTSEDMDLAVAQAALQRRRQIAAELAKQSMSPMQGQMVSGHYVGPSKLQGFAQLMSAMAGQKMEKDLDAQEQELSGKRRAGLARELDAYTGTRFGTPDQEMGPPTDAGEFGLQPGQKADPRLAAIKAVTSSMPELRQLGMMDMQNMGKQEARQETWGTRPVKDKSGKVGVLSNLGNFKEVPGLTLPEEKWIDETDEKGNKYRRNVLTNKRERVDPSGTVISIDNVGNKEALTQTGEVLKTSRGAIIQAADTRDTAGRILQALKDPAVNTGFAASFSTGLQAIGAKLGFNGNESVAKTQALAGDLAKNVLANAAALKPLSNSDITFLEAVTLGKVDMNRDALQHVAGLAYAASHNAIADSFDQFNSAKTVKGAEEITKLYPEPTIRPSDMRAADFESLDLPGAVPRMKYKGLFQQKTPQPSAPAQPQQPIIRNW